MLMLPIARLVAVCRQLKSIEMAFSLFSLSLTLTALFALEKNREKFAIGLLCVQCGIVYLLNKEGIQDEIMLI